MKESTRINRRSLHDAARDRLREMIVEGILRPGERINERELVALFGVSRTPLREALKVLAAEGSVELLPNRGARVSLFSSREVHDMFEVMGALEGLAGLLDTLQLVRRELNPRLTVAGMLLTMHDTRTRLSHDVEAEVRRHFPDLVFDTVIPRNVRIGEAPSFGKPVIHYDPHSAGADAYFELAKEVTARG